MWDQTRLCIITLSHWSCNIKDGGPDLTLYHYNKQLELQYKSQETRLDYVSLHKVTRVVIYKVGDPTKPCIITLNHCSCNIQGWELDFNNVSLHNATAIYKVVDPTWLCIITHSHWSCNIQVWGPDLTLYHYTKPLEL